MIGVLTSAHCICCFHDTRQGKKETTHHCQANKPREAGSQLPVNQIIGLEQFPFQDRFAESPFNVIAVVLGSKTSGFSLGLNSADHIFVASNAYVMSALEDNGKINLYANGAYDIGLITVKVTSSLYSSLKLAQLKLPTRYENCI